MQMNNFCDVFCRFMAIALAGRSTSRPGRTRTCDPLLRRQMLYPPELRARVHVGIVAYLVKYTVSGCPTVAAGLCSNIWR